jgi:uncharacterized protein
MFNYGGFKTERYDPNIAPVKMTKEEYKSDSLTFKFYEKLLLLKDKMNTQTGKQIALERHRWKLLLHSFTRNGMEK